MTNNLKKADNCNNLNYKCKYCGSSRINKMGTLYSKKRYLCRDCKRTFREGEDRRKKYNEDFKMDAIGWYLENVGIRKQGGRDASLLAITSLRPTAVCRRKYRKKNECK